MGESVKDIGAGAFYQCPCPVYGEGDSESEENLDFD